MDSNCPCVRALFLPLLLIFGREPEQLLLNMFKDGDIVSGMMATISVRAFCYASNPCNPVEKVCTRVCVYERE